MNENLSKELGKRVHEARINKHLSLQELATKLGYNSRTSILRIERGEQDIPLPKIQELARVLGVAPEYLMQWDDSGETKSVTIEQYDLLDAEDKAYINNYIKYLLSNEKYANKTAPGKET